MIEITPGLCQCGCGRQTNIADKNKPEVGQVKGQPLRFVRGHSRRIDSTLRRDLSGVCQCGCEQPLPYRRPSARTTFLLGHKDRREIAPPPKVELASLFTDLKPAPETRAWIYAFWNANREALYVGQVVRLHYMCRIDEHSRTATWWGEVAFYSVEEVAEPSVAEAEYQAIRKLNPRYNTANAAKCGTLSGYKLHLTRREEACEPCAEASRAHAREKRRSRGTAPRQERPQCGTKRGYESHLWYEETACEECCAANTAYYRELRRRRTEVVSAPLP